MKTTDALEEINSIAKQLLEKYHPEKIILFGSAARGEDEIQDIDIFVLKKNVPHYGSDRLMELYRLIKTDAPVDYIVYKPEEAEERLSLGDPFLRKIFQEGKVLYG